MDRKMKFAIALTCSLLAFVAFFVLFLQNSDLSATTLVVALVAVVSFGYCVYMILDKIRKYNYPPNEDIFTLFLSVLLPIVTCSLLVFAISLVMFTLLIPYDAMTILVLVYLEPYGALIVVLTPSVVSFVYCVYLALDKIKICYFSSNKQRYFFLQKLFFVTIFTVWFFLLFFFSSDFGLRIIMLFIHGPIEH